MQTGPSSYPPYLGGVNTTRISLDNLNASSARITRKVTYRPLPNHGIKDMGQWITKHKEDGSIPLPSLRMRDATNIFGSDSSLGAVQLLCVLRDL